MAKENENAAVVKDLYKSFKLPHEQHSGIKQKIINVFKGVKGYETLKVLNDISFEVKKGEFFGIVGRNGSGKSTLLKLLAGTYVPDKGLIDIKGSLTPFIELGVGFNPELTGRENIFLNGALLSFSRKEIEAMYDSIVDFAELEPFMDQKLKNYSSGMQVRLAFSIAVRAKSDILLLDEVLAVGDSAFQKKCYDYFYELKESKTTVIFVSHDQGSLERFCDRGVLVEKGKVITYGSMDDVLKSYRSIVLNQLDNNKSRTSFSQNSSNVEYANIVDVVLENEKGENSTKFLFGDKIKLKCKIKVFRTISDPIFGVTIWQKDADKAVLAVNSLIDGHKNTGIFGPGDDIEFSIELPRNLNSAEYIVEPAIANNSATVFFDQQPAAVRFFIEGGKNPHSIFSFSDHMAITTNRSRKDAKN